jgi:hypothetical protein
MRKTLTIAMAALALTGLLLAGATTASATPGKAAACSNCHKRKTAVHVSVKPISNTATTVTYKVRVTGGSGKAAWAAFSGGSNIAHRNASTGTFTVAKGTAIKVYGVKKKTGSRTKTLTAN